MRTAGAGPSDARADRTQRPSPTPDGTKTPRASAECARGAGAERRSPRGAGRRRCQQFLRFCRCSRRRPVGRGPACDVERHRARDTRSSRGLRLDRRRVDDLRRGDRPGRARTCPRELAVPRGVGCVARCLQPAADALLPGSRVRSDLPAGSGHLAMAGGHCRSRLRAGDADAGPATWRRRDLGRAREPGVRRRATQPGPAAGARGRRADRRGHCRVHHGRRPGRAPRGQHRRLYGVAVPGSGIRSCR